MLAQLVDVDVPASPAAALGPDHRVDERGETIGFADDDAGVFLAASRSASSRSEQLRGAAQAAERIFDLVRELANHQAAAVEAREQIVVARDALRAACRPPAPAAGACR